MKKTMNDFKRESTYHDSSTSRNAATPLAHAIMGDSRLALSILSTTDESALRNGAPLISARPSAETISETTERTRAALEALISANVAATQPTRGITAAQKLEEERGRGQLQYVRYTPATRGALVTGAAPAAPVTVQVFEKASDPLEPPKFRNHRVARAPGAEEPAPILHSPPRKLTAEDQKAWAIPPCVSNWKNNLGYTVPLDKRLAADGRGLQEVGINDRFAKMSEALFIAERNARTELERRAELQREYARKEKDMREQGLMDIALQARQERIASAAADAEDARLAAASPVKREPYSDGSDRDDINGVSVKTEPGDDGDSTETQRITALETEEQREELFRQKLEREERERIVGQRRREREREHRLDAYHGARGKGARDAAGRDYAEAAALGLAQGQPGSATNSSVTYDQRLFNQSEGVSGGYGADDEYNVYTKGLFTANRNASLYRPRGDTEMYGSDSAAAGAEVGKLATAERFRPERDFSGVDRSAPAQPRSKPVAFEREADPFGLGAMLDDTRGAVQHHALDSVGKSGTMLAGSATFSSRSTYDREGSGRTSVAFQSAKHDTGVGDGKFAAGLTMRTPKDAGSDGPGEQPVAKKARSGESDDGHRSGNGGGYDNHNHHHHHHSSSSSRHHSHRHSHGRSHH